MKKLSLLAALLCLSALLVIPAGALEYTVAAPEDHLFARPTSDDTIYKWEDPNVDRSKNTALIPPAFGSPTSYLPGSGEYLTPNLVPGVLDGGGLVNQAGAVNAPAAGEYPTVSAGNPAQTAGFTAVSSDLRYANGSLGTLSIPRLGVNASIFEGTDSAALAKGIGHFTGTSIWDGNCCFAAHNRGVNAYFGQIHTLNIGDTITLTTKLGTRTYAVTSVEKVPETDLSDLSASTANQITLYTCVRDQPAYRWCVKGVEIV